MREMLHSKIDDEGPWPNFQKKSGDPTPAILYLEHGRPQSRHDTRSEQPHAPLFMSSRAFFILRRKEKAHLPIYPMLHGDCLALCRSLSALSRNVTDSLRPDLCQLQISAGSVHRQHARHGTLPMGVPEVGPVQPVIETLSRRC